MLSVDSCDGIGNYLCMDSVWCALTTLGRTLNYGRCRRRSVRFLPFIHTQRIISDKILSLRSFRCLTVNFEGQASAPRKFPTETSATTIFKLGSIRFLPIISNSLVPCSQDLRFGRSNGTRNYATRLLRSLTA